MWARMNTTGACRPRWRAARRRRGPTTARIPTIMAVTPATTAATIRMPTAQASASALVSAVEAGAAAGKVGQPTKGFAFDIPAGYGSQESGWLRPDESGRGRLRVRATPALWDR